MSKRAISLLAPVVVALIVYLLPTPEGLSPQAWQFMAIFMGVVVGLIIEPVPAALVGLLGICIVAMLGLAGKSPADNIKWALAGFSNATIWLIFAAFMFAAGYQKTGLGKRISLIMVKYMGKSSLGLGYAVALVDGILAPFMPSNTARSGGTIYPVAINIPKIFNSLPDNEPRKLGAYLSWVAMGATCVTSSMFLTGLAPNLLAIDLTVKGSGLAFEWGQWASIMVPIMLPLLLLTPWLTYVIYPPTQKHSPEAPAWAAAELEKMGKITTKELLMAFYAMLALVLWIFGKQLGMNATTVAISIVALMTLTNIITWDDVLSNKGAWNVLVWFATLVALASGLKNVGILEWIGKIAEASLTGMDPMALMVAMLVSFFFLHYLFASVTAHVTALLPIFVIIAMKFIDPSQVHTFLILLMGTLGIMGIITPYATGPSPIWYGAGYISQATWWGLGAIFGVIYLAALLLGLFIFI